jgi:KipI family sensor histidine kinase inhibitor
MEVRRVGESALLVTCADLAEVRATYARARREVDAVDVVPAARTVLLDGLVDLAVTRGVVAGWEAGPGGSPAEQPEGPLVELPVTYDGPDVADVARRWEVTSAEVARLHTAQEYVVAFCGFAPGFAYCTGLPDALAVPRHERPRPRVEPGSVGLAGEYTGVYPTASPGGWRVIGRTATKLWHPDEDEPALLTPGTRVRFVDG